jgi:hypothetical protein
MFLAKLTVQPNKSTFESLHSNFGILDTYVFQDSINFSTVTGNIAVML